MAVPGGIWIVSPLLVFAVVVFAAGVLAAINEGLAAVRASGVYDEIYNTWIIGAEGEEEAALALADDLSQSISGEGAFAAAARKHSKSPTATNGGQLDWMPLANLPAAIGGSRIALARGRLAGLELGRGNPCQDR